MTSPCLSSHKDSNPDTETMRSPAARRHEKKLPSTGQRNACTKPDSTPTEQKQAAMNREAPDYDLTPPEDFPILPEVLHSLCQSCHEAGLTREQAMSHLSWLHAHHKALHERISTARKQWIRELREDSEFGRDRFNDTVRNAIRALDAFDPDGTIRELLEESRFGDHPAIIRACARIGRALLEDRAFARSSGRRERIPLEERLYPHM